MRCSTEFIPVARARWHHWRYGNLEESESLDVSESIEECSCNRRSTNCVLLWSTNCVPCGQPITCPCGQPIACPCGQPIACPCGQPITSPCFSRYVQLLCCPNIMQSYNQGWLLRSATWSGALPRDSKQTGTVSVHQIIWYMNQVVFHQISDIIIILQGCLG